MVNLFPENPEISSGDLQMMEALGVARSIVNRLRDHADLPGSDQSISSNKPAPAGLSPLEVYILGSGGARGLEASLAESRARETRMALTLLRDFREMVHHSHELDSVAKLLKISPEAALERVNTTPPTLRAFRQNTESAWLFPHWQFSSSGCIPALDRVLSEARVSLSLWALSRVMLMKHVDLESDGESLSPRDWLVQGYSPDAVLTLLRDV